MRLFFGILAVLIGLVAWSNAAQVVVGELFETADCTGTKVATYPYFLDNACQVLNLDVFPGGSSTPGANASFEYSCGSSNFDTFIGDVTCDGSTPSTTAFSECRSNKVRYSCEEIPDNSLVLFQAGSCSLEHEFGLGYEILLAVNLCLRVDSGFRAMIGDNTYYFLTVASNKTITYKTFTDDACTQGTRITLRGVLDDVCASFDGAPSGFILKTAVAGATVDIEEEVGTGSAASSLGANLAVFMATLSCVPVMMA